jgi:hypothetical protein
MTWAKHAAYTESMINAYKAYCQKTVREATISEAQALMVQDYNMTQCKKMGVVWNGFIWLSTGSNSGLL